MLWRTCTGLGGAEVDHGSEVEVEPEGAKPVADRAPEAERRLSAAPGELGGGRRGADPRLEPADPATLLIYGHKRSHR